MTDPAQTPATQADVQFLYGEFGKLHVLFEELEKRLIHAVGIMMEDLRHDLIGTTKDRLSDHENRLVRLEKHARFTHK